LRWRRSSPSLRFGPLSRIRDHKTHVEKEHILTFGGTTNESLRVVQFIWAWDIRELDGAIADVGGDDDAAGGYLGLGQGEAAGLGACAEEALAAAEEQRKLDDVELVDEVFCEEGLDKSRTSMNLEFAAVAGLGFADGGSEVGAEEAGVLPQDGLESSRRDVFGQHDALRRYECCN